MILILNNLGTSFVLGLLTPLTAVCVLPLYPGFLSFLSNKIERQENKKKALLFFGILVVFGVITFMMVIGLLFTTILQVSLTGVINIVSPIAFAILFLISFFLVFDVDTGKIFPQINTPTSKNSYLGAFFYGFFFGVIVIPCNPLFIATLFARTLSNTSFFINVSNFFFFGLGIGFPLLLFSIISSASSRAVINILAKHKRNINQVAGLFMMTVSIYYLFYVFRVQALLF